ncbi:MAG TPA: hypothetical protein VGF67_18950 [Ktedonobacteraceae bacterium]
MKIWHTLQQRASLCTLIYLDIEERERIRRLAKRDGLDPTSLQLTMRHTMETGIPLLRLYADLVLCNKSIDTMVVEIMLLPILQEARLASSNRRRANQPFGTGGPAI